MKSGFFQRIEQAAASVRDRMKGGPAIGVILGSGLSGLADEFPGITIPYGEIAEFPKPTVEGHRGIMTVAESCIIMAGRFHYYEGHAIDDVILPVALLSKLGAKVIILTNAAGGVNGVFELRLRPEPRTSDLSLSGNPKSDIIGEFSRSTCGRGGRAAEGAGLENR